MKKTIQKLVCLCVLLTGLSFNAFSGDYPAGGKSCQPTQQTSCSGFVEQNQEKELEINIENYVYSIFVIVKDFSF